MGLNLQEAKILNIKLHHYSGRLLSLRDLLSDVEEGLWLPEHRHVTSAPHYAVLGPNLGGASRFGTIPIVYTIYIVGTI